MNRLTAGGLLRQWRVTRWLPHGECEVDGHQVVNFIANDYLNLASDPRVCAAAASAISEAGVGSRASALLGGRSPWHERLEQQLAGFEGAEAAILFPTGHAANLGTLAALIDSQDVVFCDRYNHASLVDGCRLSGAKFRVYRHDQLDRLEQALRKPVTARRRWIVTDGVFSMEGDLAPLPALCDLARRHDAEVIVDEAHATGVFGERGRGAAEHFGVEQHVAVRIGTLSKALGCLGGFVAGPSTLIDFLWNSARAQIYSTALPPAICAAAGTAVTILQQEPDRRRRLHQACGFLRQQLAGHGVPVSTSSTGPIIPIEIGEPQTTVDLAERLRERGFLVGAVRPPTVPRGTSRLRISLSTAHTDDQLTRLAVVVGEEWANRG